MLLTQQKLSKDEQGRSIHSLFQNRTRERQRKLAAVKFKTCIVCHVTPRESSWHRILLIKKD